MEDSLRSLILRFASALLLVSSCVAGDLRPSPFEFAYSGGVPVQIKWQGSTGRYYDLLSSKNLIEWGQVDGFPKPGTGALVAEFLEPTERQFFKMASSSDPNDFLLPEVAAYKNATGITTEAAGEINHFLRLLRGAGVDPVLFWVGGSRYNSVSGSTARAVIGGNGIVSGSLAARGELHETFTGTQAITFANPLKNASQSRVGFFAGAAATNEASMGGLITGDNFGPNLSAAWGGGNFRVFNQTGVAPNYPGFGGFARSDIFLPYVGAAYDGYNSVLCGIGKSLGTRNEPLRYFGMPESQFPGQNFVNSQDAVRLGAPGFSGKLYFAVVTASDLTDNRRAYEIVSIPRRSGFGSYGTQTAAVFLGDSITYGYISHVSDSDGRDPPHKGGGQWNRNFLGLLANPTGEGNATQIQYFEKGARHALDKRTWDHVFYVCGSGGHYPYGEQTTQNPLSQATKVSLDGWVSEYHEKIAVPAAELGAEVIQMTYIYGCPNKFSDSVNPEIYRTFTDYFVDRQRKTAQAAGFAIFDAYLIPQLHEPIAGFYGDAIHPNEAGNRLLAQEFAASVAHPTSRIPRSLSRPVVTGQASVASLLSVLKGSWAFTPNLYSYQWMRDADDIPGAISPSYLPSNADVGFHLSCRITATNAYGSAERTSGHTAKITP